MLARHQGHVHKPVERRARRRAALLLGFRATWRSRAAAPLPLPRCHALAPAPSGMAARERFHLVANVTPESAQYKQQNRKGSKQVSETRTETAELPKNIGDWTLPQMAMQGHRFAFRVDTDEGGAEVETPLADVGLMLEVVKAKIRQQPRKRRISTVYRCLMGVLHHKAPTRHWVPTEGARPLGGSAGSLMGILLWEVSYGTRSDLGLTLA